MRKIVRGLLPSPALIVACVALFVALGGVGYAALTGKDKKKVRGIADQEIAKQAPGMKVANAGNAANAERLGGMAADAFQRFCTGGGIKATIVVNTTGASNTNFTDVPGFNCFRPGNTTSSVQLERLAQGQYYVRFVGNSGPNASGSAVATRSAATATSLMTWRTRRPFPARTCSSPSSTTRPATWSTTGRSRCSPSSYGQRSRRAVSGSAPRPRASAFGRHLRRCLAEVAPAAL
jgi:hypothetical protein